MKPGLFHIHRWLTRELDQEEQELLGLARPDHNAWWFQTRCQRCGATKEPVLVPILDDEDYF